jgi:hypothetical protein
VYEEVENFIAARRMIEVAHELVKDLKATGFCVYFGFKLAVEPVEVTVS